MQDNIDKCAELVSEDIVTTAILHDPTNTQLGVSSLRDLFEAAGFKDQEAQRTMVGWISFMFHKEMGLYEATNFDIYAITPPTLWQKVQRYFRGLGR